MPRLLRETAALLAGFAFAAAVSVADDDVNLRAIAAAVICAAAGVASTWALLRQQRLTTTERGSVADRALGPAE